MPDTGLLTDEQLVVKICEGEAELYSDIMHRYQDRLSRYVHYILLDSDRTADVVQETFIKAYVNLKGFDGRRIFSSWIYRIAHNEAMNAVTRSRVALPLLTLVGQEQDEGPENDMAREEIRLHVDACLDHLPVKYREPLFLAYLEDKSYEEISDILRMPVGTVGTRINRAKALMKKLCRTK